MKDKITTTLSPWDSPLPKFKELPENNPKTDEPFITYMCTVCGGLVINRKLHLNWHKQQ